MSDTEGQVAREYYRYPCTREHCDRSILGVGDHDYDYDYGYSDRDVRCARLLRLLEHSSDVGKLVISCTTTFSLLVGPEKVEMTCHKALLGLKSEYFDAICYGGFATANARSIELRSEKPEAIQTFISWLHSGQLLSSPIELFELWLSSPQFYNEVMHKLFGRYVDERMYAEDYQLMFAETTPVSKLRCFCRDTILAEGPLADELSEERRAAWETLVKEGGNLVVGVTLRGGLYQKLEKEKEPYYWKVHDGYLELITTRPTEEFIEGRPFRT